MSVSTNDNSFDNDHINLIEPNIPFQEDNNNQLIQKNKLVPETHKKTFYCVRALFILGIILLVIGIEEYFRTDESKTPLCFIILGAIVLIPGGYFTYKFIQIYCSRDRDLREELLDDIPIL